MKLAVFDIGGTSVKAGYFIDNELVNRESFNTPNSFEKLVLCMKRYVTSDVDGVAISAPGVVDTKLRVIKNESAVPYIHNRPIFDELEDALGKTVAIENDANCAGICEMNLGAGKDFSNAAFIVIGTGVGGAIFINKKIYKGTHLFAGEFGFIRDNNKTVSQVATLVRGVESYNSKNLNFNIKSGEQLFSMAEDGDELANEIIENIYDTLAKTIYNLQVAFDFDAFILGGGISARENLNNEIKSRVSKLLKNNVTANVMPEIKNCKYHNDANLYGAAINFMETQCLEVKFSVLK